MTSDKIQSALAEQKKQFNDTVLLPNTLQRNIILADHRNEIARLEKCLLTSAKAKVSAAAAKNA